MHLIKNIFMKKLVTFSLILSLFSSCFKQQEKIDYRPLFASGINVVVYVDVIDEKENSLINSDFLEEVSVYGELSKKAHNVSLYKKRNKEYSLIEFGMQLPNDNGVRLNDEYQTDTDGGKFIHLKSNTILIIKGQEFLFEGTFLHRISKKALDENANFYGGNAISIQEVKIGNKVFKNQPDEGEFDKIVIPFIYQNGKISVK